MNNKYIEIYGNTIALFKKEKVKNRNSYEYYKESYDGYRWKVCTFVYKEITIVDDGVIADGIKYTVENFHKEYFMDKLKDKELGLLEIYGVDTTVRLSMIYPTYTVINYEGIVEYRVYESLELDGNRLSFNIAKYRVLLDVLMDDMKPIDKVILNNIVKDKTIGTHMLVLMSEVYILEVSLWDKFIRYFKGYNFIKFKINGYPMWIYDGLIFGHLGRH